MVVKSLLVSTLVLASSTSFAASSLIAQQFITPRNLIGGALPQSQQDTFTVRTGYPSNYSRSLNYSTGPIINTSGNSVAPGNASTSISFDLLRGEFKLYSESLLPTSGLTVGELGAVSVFNLYDYLTIHSPTASSTNPAFLTLHLEVEGEVALLNKLPNPDTSQLLRDNATIKSELTVRNETDRSLSAGHAHSFCSYFTGDGCISSSGATFDGGGFATADANLTDGGLDEITVRVPLYHEISVVQFSVRLEAYNQQGLTDLSHTAKLFINTPGGTYTSESGIISAVPEPEIYSMIFAGLFLIGAVSRRRGIFGESRVLS